MFRAPALFTLFTLISSLTFAQTQSPPPDAWFGFANNTSPQDHEQALRSIAPDFQRIDVPGPYDGFDALCLSRRMYCVQVKDWTGATQPCNDIPEDNGKPYRDGSRIVLCSATVSKGTPVSIPQADALYQQKNYAAAFPIYLSGANQGDIFCEDKVGMMYAAGLGTPRDSAKAMSWYRKAAAMGSSDANLNIGFMYLDGVGNTPRSPATAAQWFAVAAGQGNAVAQTNLGLLYMNGQGVPKNPALAQAWFEKAAAQGYGAAKLHLSQMGISPSPPVAPAPQPAPSQPSQPTSQNYANCPVLSSDPYGHPMIANSCNAIIAVVAVFPGHRWHSIMNPNVPPAEMGPLAVGTPYFYVCGSAGYPVNIPVLADGTLPTAQNQTVYCRPDPSNVWGAANAEY